ncbi:hypothetical protein [Streptomyces puniciscabiei]|uniref:hypothetical protein n=1 Tax=Streptomyces puniciscabiei TaxID=164348 RepID=UPI0033232800
MSAAAYKAWRQDKVHAGDADARVPVGLCAVHRGLFVLVGGRASRPAPPPPGSDVRVVLTDLRAAPGEDSLTVTSPVFKGPLTIKTDSPDDPGCTCDDGGTVYAGHGQLRGDVPGGRYTVTVVSHHGQQTTKQHVTKQHVTIAGQPVADGGDPSWAVTGGVAATGLALASGGAFAVRVHQSDGS